MGQFTNGFDNTKVMAAMTGRLGWKQSTVSGSPQIDGDNSSSTSGRYFNDGSFHPLVTVSNIKATAEDADLSDDSLNLLLLEMQKAAISKTVTSVFNVPEVLEQKMLFERSLNNDRPITNSSKFVGIRFKLAGPGLALQIKNISLYFNQAKDFNIYLFHETKAERLWQQQVSTVANDMTVIVPEEELILSSSGLMRSGYYYLGYFQDDLQDAMAINEETCNDEHNCFEWDFFQSTVTDGAFDRRTPATTSLTFGMNADITVFRDHTDSIIRNAPMFDNAIGLSVAYMVCKQILYAVRSNATERTLKDQLDKFGLQYELDGQVPASEVERGFGLRDMYNQELTRIKESFYPKRKSMVVSW